MKSVTPRQAPALAKWADKQAAEARATMRALEAEDYQTSRQWARRCDSLRSLQARVAKFDGLAAHYRSIAALAA